MKFKNLCTVFGLVSLLAACSSEKSETVENTNQNATEKAEKTPDPKVIEAEQYVLTTGRAGQIPIGISSDSLKKMVPAENLKTTERELEGQKYTAYEIRNAKAGNQLLMLAEESCEKDSCKIFRLRIISPKFKTKEGIRVGSTFGEVQKTYPLSFIGLGETDFVAVSDKQKMTFTLDIAKFPPKPLYKIKAEDIPDSALVTSIMLY